MQKPYFTRIKRQIYICSYYSTQPSKDKLIELFNNRGNKLFKLARYVLKDYNYFDIDLHLFILVELLYTIILF